MTAHTAQRSTIPRSRISRSSQRGAVVFVVIMAMMLLTAVGVFAAYSAGITTRSAGYQRSAAQARYTSELGVLVSTGYFSVPGRLDANVKIAEAGNGTPDECLSVPSGEFCRRIWMEDIDEVFHEQYGDDNHYALDLTGGGSMDAHGDIEGSYRIELTGRRAVDVQGNALSGGAGHYEVINLTSYSLVRPYTANVCTDAAGENSVASMYAMRAQVIVGPIQ